MRVAPQNALPSQAELGRCRQYMLKGRLPLRFQMWVPVKSEMPDISAQCSVRHAWPNAAIIWLLLTNKWPTAGLPEL